MWPILTNKIASSIIFQVVHVVNHSIDWHLSMYFFLVDRCFFYEIEFEPIAFPLYLDRPHKLCRLQMSWEGVCSCEAVGASAICEAFFYRIRLLLLLLLLLCHRFLYFWTEKCTNSIGKKLYCERVAFKLAMCEINGEMVCSIVNTK